MTGTATYTVDGNTTPTDHTGATGTFGSATFSVDFARQSANVGVNVSTAAGAWVGTANNLRLDDGGGFFASVGTTSPFNALSVTLGGSNAGTYGSLEGTLLGTGLNAAGLTYAFGGPSNVGVTGAVAFKTTAQDTAAPYRLGLLAVGMTGAGAVESEYNNFVGGGVNAAGRLSIDTAGIVTGFDGALPTAHAGGIAEVPTRFNAQAVALATPSSPGSTPTTAAGTYSDSGTNAATGISWGRYVGFVDARNRITGTPVTIIDVAGGTTPRMGATGGVTGNWHSIAGPQQTGSVVLPVTGTVTYNLVGGTNPTDNMGVVGTGSASLSANFSAQTVNTAVTISGAVGNWSASASNVPIQQGVYFEAQKSGGTGNLTVTSTTVTGTTSGTVVGAFTGTTGQGAIVAYSLNAGGNVATNAAARTVSGVAAFQKAP